MKHEIALIAYWPINHCFDQADTVLGTQLIPKLGNSDSATMSAINFSVGLNVRFISMVVNCHYWHTENLFTSVQGVI